MRVAWARCTKPVTPNSVANVAVKVLAEGFTQNPERLTRFEREARLLASLNHPNIATIHDIEESDGVRYLVMELVPGETLAERITQGAMPVDEALPIFKQIAEALEAAHEKGIIHRDLKPANIKITPDGLVKVLDFGLAKALEDDEPAADSSQSPTLTKGTALGAIMGTAAYMSPEQARGKTVDKRTDIWAFGCCLYEALTGKKPFHGETVTDTLAAIIDKDPDWRTLPAAVPWRVRDITRRCLRKDRTRRLQDIGNVRVDIQDVLTGPPDETAGLLVGQKPSVRPALSGLLLLIGVMLGGLLAWFIKRSPPPESPPPTRFTISLPEGQVLGGPSLPFSLSPDGRRLTYVVREGSDRRLYVRELSEFEAQLLPGTEGASSPFFSPDGQWIGFFANESLKKVSITGGAADTICETPAFIRPAFDPGALWCPDNRILFSGWIYGLLRVSADGGVPETVVAPGTNEFFQWPDRLPGGKKLLLTRWKRGRSQLAVISLETKEVEYPMRDIGGAGQVKFLPSGHLLFAESGSLRGVHFDPAKVVVLGEPFPIKDGLFVTQLAANQPVHYYSVSETGTLAFAAGSSPVDYDLVWVDRQGRVSFIAKETAFDYPRISPDGTRVAANFATAEGTDIWIYDLARETRTRLTFGPYFGEAVWSPDGKEIVFSDGSNLYRSPADGSNPPKRLATIEGGLQLASSISADDILAFYRVPRDAPRDIWAMNLKEDGSESPLIATEFDEHSPIFSPDGRWIAYVSDESGQEEVYVRPYPGLGSKHSISVRGGREPQWSGDGRELFYRNGDSMMSVRIETEPEFKAGNPQVLFEGPFHSSAGAGNSYDVSSDGQRFVMIRKNEIMPTEIHIVLNWFEDLERLVPTQ